MERTVHGDVLVDDYEWLRAKDDPEVTAHLEAENAYDRADRAPGRPARDALRRDQGPHPRDRPLRAQPGSAATGYGALLRGQGVRRELPGPGHRPRPTGPPRSPPRTARPASRRSPASRCCSTSTSSPRATTSSRSAAPPVSPDEHLLAYSHRRRRRRALHGAGQGPAHRRAARPTRSPASSAGSPGTAAVSTSTTRRSTRPGARTRSGGTASAPPPRARRAGPPRGRPALLARRRPDPQRPVPGDRGRAPRPPGVPLPRRRRPRAGSAVRVRRARGRPRVPPRARGHRRRGRASWCCTTAPAPTSSSAPHPRAADPADRLAAADRARPGGPPRGRRRLRRPPGGPPAQRRPHPAPGPRARRAEAASPTTTSVEFRRRGLHHRLGGNPEFEQPTVRLRLHHAGQPPVVSTPTTSGPASYACSGDPVLRDFDPAAYEQHRLWATAPTAPGCRSRSWCRPGRSGTGPCRSCSTGTAPTRPPSTPTSRSPGCPSSTAGPAFAIAHVRGGGEMGRHWYDDGQAAAQAAHLHRLRRLRPAPRRRGLDHAGPAGRRGRQRRRPADRCGRQPGAGAVRRHRRRGAVRRHLTTMLDASLPLTVIEYDEWGNPEARPRGVPLPSAPTRRTTTWPRWTTRRSWPRRSLNDTRVLYVEPAKWVARLRERATGRRDVTSC